MVTLSTLELRGLLNDVIPFAGTDEDYPALNCVRLEWTGEELLAQATNGFSVAQITWTPDEEEFDDNQESLISLYGFDPTAPRFRVRIGLEDAKNIVRAYTLKGAKKQFAPVGITVEEENIAENTYRVVFHRDAGGDSWKALTFKASGRGSPRPHSDDAPEVDLAHLIAGSAGVEAYLPSVWWTPKALAAFGKCRNHGALEMEFTGENCPVRWKMGHRFEGLIQPVRQDPEPPRRGRELLEGEEEFDDLV